MSGDVLCRYQNSVGCARKVVRLLNEALGKGKGKNETVGSAAKL